RADLAAAFHQRNNGTRLAFIFPAAFRVWRDARPNEVLMLGATVIGFVGFNDAAAAGATKNGYAPVAHGLANAMAHEPRGLVADIERAVQLMGRDALLAAAHQMEGLQPLVQGDFGTLHDRPHGDSEIFAAKLLGAAEYA